MTSSLHEPTVYLAGGMERAGENGRIWRQDITPHLEGLGYRVWNPYTEEMNVGINVESLAKLKENDYNTYLKYCTKIVDYDLKCLVECSLVAVLIDDSVLKGAGTYGELTVCRLYDVPVYAWIDLPNGRYDVPSWAMGCLTHYTEDKDEFYATIPTAAESIALSDSLSRGRIEDYVRELSPEFSDT